MAFDIQSIINQGKILFSGFQSTDSFVGIDIGTSSIKVVQLKKERGIIVLQTYGELALGPYVQEPVGKVVRLQPKELSQALIDCLKESQVTLMRGLYGVSAQSSLVFVISLPPVNEKQIGSIIENEARKYIPIPLSEVSLDWWKIPQKETYEEVSEKPQSDTIEVLVSALRKDEITKMQDIANIASVPASGFEIETFSLMRSALRRELAPIMLVDCGASAVRIAIVEYGVIRILHSLPRGGDFLTQTIAQSQSVSFAKGEELKRQLGTDIASPAVQEIANTYTKVISGEMKNVLRKYEQDYKKALSQVIISGGGSRLHGLQETLQNDFGVPVRHIHPFEKVQAPEFMRDLLQEAGPHFAIALGLALRDVA